MRGFSTRGLFLTLLLVIAGGMVATRPAGTLFGPSQARADEGAVPDASTDGTRRDPELAVQQAIRELGPHSTVTRTDHFVIVSDCDLNWTQARAGLLERTAHQFAKFTQRLGLPASPGSERLLCVLINDHDAYEAFARQYDGVEASWIAGYYASLSNRIVFYNDATNPGLEEAVKRLGEYDKLAVETRNMAADARRDRRVDAAATLESRADELSGKVSMERRRLSQASQANALAKAIHEASHLLSFNWGPQARDRQYPFWMTEGMAVSFETDKPNQAFGPDHAYAPREADFLRLRAEGRLIPLEVLVQLTSVPADDEQQAEVMYAQSASLFRWMFRFEREALAGMYADLLKEPPGRITPARHLEVFRARFGDTVALERRWLRATEAPSHR